MPIPTVESTAAPLPFLVEHGAWVWKALIGLAAVGAPGLVRLLRRRRAATHVARVVRSATVELRPGPVVLRGRLSGADVRSSRQQVWSYAAPQVTARPAGEVALTVGDAQVRLDGNVEVVAGTRATVERRAGRRRDGALIAWRQELTVVAGAEVVCVGRLEHTADGTWTLRADLDQHLELYAIAHRGAAEPTARLRLASYGVLAAVGMAVMLAALGVALERRIHAAARNEEASLADIPLRVQVAAMTPTGRAETMRWVEHAAGDAVGRAAIGRALTVGRRRGTDVLTGQLLELDRHEELLALARRRGDDALMFVALTRLARFAEAADVMARLPDVARRDAVEVTIAAGRWADAATLVDAEAQARVSRRDQEALGCVAAWMRMKHGDAAAGQALQQAARRTRACALIVAAVASPAAVPPLPDGWRSFDGERQVGWHDLALALAGERVGCSLDRSATWMVPYVALYLGDGPEAADDPADEAVGWGTAAGQGRRCRAAWALIADLPGADARRLKSDAVYTMAPVRDTDDSSKVGAAAALRNGAFVARDLWISTRVARDAVLAALAGDARPLARYLEHHTLAMTAQIVLGIAPHLHDGRGDLAEALLWSPQLTGSTLDRGTTLAATLRRAFVRRTIFRLLGRDDLAAADAAIVARVVEVLSDRDKLLALAFWGAR